VNLDYIVAYAYITVNPNGYKVLLFILLFKSGRLYNQTSTSTKIVFNFFFKYNVVYNKVDFVLVKRSLR